jgi:FRG domain
MVIRKRVKFGRWRASRQCGTRRIDTEGWLYFNDFIAEYTLDWPQFIWRGHASAKWLLEPSLDRILRRLGMLGDQEIRQNHLLNFKYASRGRRGANPVRLASDNDWWALGQHFGLLTPLLDWTTSPYVAAYFAFLDERSGPRDPRAVFGLSRSAVEERSNAIRAAWQSEDRPPVVDIIDPLSDDNPRLVSQSGLFTRAPDGVDIEKWILTNFPETKPQPARLIKITIPNRDRGMALKNLNRMNVNHLSLFPDLGAAATISNLKLSVRKY